MKKIIMMCFYLSSFLFFINAQSKMNDFVYSYLEDVIYYCSFNGQFYEINTTNKTYYNLTNYIYTDSNKYIWIKINKKTDNYLMNPNEEYLILGGSNQFFNLLSQKRISENHTSNEKSFINKIKAIDFLIEKINQVSITYDAQSFNKKFFTTDKEFRYELVSSSLPWAIQKNKINTAKLEIEFEDQVDSLTFLNGYIDLLKPTLYKRNSRVKDIEIKDINSNKTINFLLSDIVQFQDFKLPFSTDKIQVKVLSYYPGTDFTDICLSLITPKFTNKMSKSARYIKTPDLLLLNGKFLQEFKEKEF